MEEPDRTKINRRSDLLHRIFHAMYHDPASLDDLIQLYLHEIQPSFEEVYDLGLLLIETNHLESLLLLPIKITPYLFPGFYDRLIETQDGDLLIEAITSQKIDSPNILNLIEKSIDRGYLEVARDLVCYYTNRYKTLSQMNMNMILHALVRQARKSRRFLVDEKDIDPLLDPDPQEAAILDCIPIGFRHRFALRFSL